MPRYSSDELKAMQERGESRTDLARAKAMTDRQIDAAVASDPDAVDLPDDWHRTARFVPAKEAISIRLDADLLGFFRKDGPGWQTRINAVLRAYKEASERPR
jgi:uncharacterized protein (DUF4415 family)